jgi:hypothetical protein
LLLNKLNGFAGKVRLDAAATATAAAGAVGATEAGGGAVDPEFIKSTT